MKNRGTKIDPQGRTWILRTKGFLPEDLRKLASMREQTGYTDEEILHHLIQHAQVAKN